MIPRTPYRLDLRGSLKAKSARRLIAEREESEQRRIGSVGLHRLIRANTAIARRVRELATRLSCEEPQSLDAVDPQLGVVDDGSTRV